MSDSTPEPLEPNAAWNARLAMLLASTNVVMVMLVAVALGVGLAVQIIVSTPHTPDPTLMSAFTFVIGVIFGNYGQLFNFSFGSTPTTKAKDQTIQTQAAALAKRDAITEPPLKVDVVGTPGNPPEGNA